MWVLSGHYQGERNFTFEGLEAARNRRNNWRERIALCYQNKDEVKDATEDNFAKILAAVSENLNSAEAFAVIDGSKLTLDEWRKVDELFGLKLITDTPDIAPERYELIRERDKARAEKNYAKSDEIRDELVASGIGVRDTADGGVWYYL